LGLDFPSRFPNEAPSEGRPEFLFWFMLNTLAAAKVQQNPMQNQVDILLVKMV
jgi:hypothetical protein